MSDKIGRWVEWPQYLPKYFFSNFLSHIWKKLCMQPIKITFLGARTCSSKILSSLFLWAFLFSFDFSKIFNFFGKKTRFFYFRILVEFFVRVGWIKILVRSRFGLAEWKRENEESRWCSSAKSETQRIIRKDIIQSDNTVRFTVKDQFWQIDKIA